MKVRCFPSSGLQEGGNKGNAKGTRLDWDVGPQVNTFVAWAQVSLKGIYWQDIALHFQYSKKC